MSHGAQVFDAGGQTIYDSSWRQWRFIETLTLAPGSSGSKDYSSIPDVYEVCAVGFPQSLTSTGHTISVSVKVVTWAWFSFSSPLSGSATTLMSVFSR